MNIKDYQNYHENKPHVEADFPYNTYLCSIPLDFSSVSLHWHEETEIIYIKKGEGKINIDLEIFHAKAGDIFFIMPGRLHAIEQYNNNSMEYENILFNMNMLMCGSNDVCTRDFFKPILKRNINIPVLLTSAHPVYTPVASCIDEIDNLRQTLPYGVTLAIKGCLFKMFFILLSTKCPDTALKYPQKTVEKLKSLLKFVEENYMNKITIAMAAKHLNYSESHFMKFFKQSMGTSFTDYLNDYRLNAAQRLLTDTSEDITGIALNCGFDNISYFNRLFKRKYGTTPHKYRKGE